MDRIEPKKESLVAKYLKELFEKTGGNGNYIYRGQGSAVWELQSSAQRRLIKQEEIDKKKFRSQDFILYHKHLIENARDLGYDKNDNKSKGLSELEILAEIQHHGGATCLTDFTTNFLVALWFASKQENISKIETFEDEKGLKRTNEDGKIFALNLNDEENFEKIYPIKKIRVDDTISGLLEKRVQYNGEKKTIEPRFWVWKPARLNNRIVQQDSIFMFGLARFKDNLKYEAVYISKNEKDDLRKELENYFDLSAESVFDDLPGFSFEANNADKPISNKIFEKKRCIKKAKDSFKRGEYETAIKYYNRNLQCLMNPCEMCENQCEIPEPDLLFGRGKCYFQLDDKIQALSDFEAVISLKDKDEKNVLGASRLKIFILYDLEYFSDAFFFCHKIIKESQGKTEEMKEFYFSALELSVIIGDKDKFDFMNGIIRGDNILCKKNGELLRFYFESIQCHYEYSDFLKELDKKEISSLDSSIFWNFEDIDKYLKMKNDTNLILITQKTKEIQTRLRNEEIEKLC
jgi:hypothetical protein